MENIQWPGWEVVRLIGNGSFGSVYEIQRDLYGNVERAALKVIHIPQSRSDIEELYNDGYDDESITARFHGYLEDIIREYSMMANMKGCKNVVYCDDVRQIQHEDGIGWDIYIKMELLTPLVRTLGREIPEQQVVNIGIDMCSALVLCREHNIVHRDIKPQNIFVSPDGTYKLGDFGIAKTAERTTSGTKTGTYKYMAPEVYRSQPYGAAADQYSLGMVLYWLLNERRTPFLPLPGAAKAPTVTQEDEARKRRFDGEPLPAPAHGSPELQQIVLKACAYDAKDRYASAADMLAALRSLRETAAAAPIAAAAGNDDADERTVGVFFAGTPAAPAAPAPAPAPQPAEPPAEPAPAPRPIVHKPPKKPLVKRQTAAQEAAEEKQKKKALPWLIGAAVLALALTGTLLLLNRKKTPEADVQLAVTEPDETQALSTEAPETEPGETAAVQLEWTEWADALPEGVSAESYDVEERTLYRSRSLETKSSTETDHMDGWELFDTVDANGGYGAWSDWSQNAVSKSDSRDVETRTRYRYSDKETTTSGSSSLSGWTQYDTTYSWGDYGGWSAWSTDPAYSGESRQAETKTQYRYRNITYTTEYTDWGGWSDWQDSYVGSNSTTDVQTRTVYGYYWYQCPNCGAHMHGWGFTCPTWAGGCGKAELKTEHWHAYWSTTAPGSVGFSDWYGTGHYYAYVDGILVFRWDYGNPGPKTQYRYRTRSTYQASHYGDWSGWEDTSYSASSNREVETRTVYRYRDRSQVPTYCFYRWKDWSAWSDNAVSESGSRRVETATFYRWRDRVTETTYFFRRWTDWTEFSESPVESSEDTEAEMKTQYRYKSKEA